jgi:hypothetical protein
VLRTYPNYCLASRLLQSGNFHKEKSPLLNPNPPIHPHLIKKMFDFLPLFCNLSVPREFPRRSNPQNPNYQKPMTTWKMTEEWHSFDIVTTPERVVFGGTCNAGFLESGYIEREDFECLDETLQELLSDLEAYYRDGPEYVARIVCNARM